MNIDKSRGNAHAICFRKVNKGARFVCDCSVETMFYEDHFENCEFDKFDFQTVLFCVNKKVLTCLQHTHSLRSRILMTSNTNIPLRWAFKKCFDRIHHTDETFKSSSFSINIVNNTALDLI